YYPPVLDNGLDHQLREQRKQIAHMLTARGVHLTQAAINNGIMYKAATTEFGETMDEEWVFFIKQGKSRKPLFLASAQEEKV
ncbi:MAG: hypothetical protein WCR47_05235, partial [Desulfoplanes sp.]